MKMEETLSYDDVLLLPGYSEILPRDADVRTRLAADIRLNVPILSSAMDTVTEDALAIALALEGGAGVIHRNLGPEEQAEQVANVKRYLNWIIDSPVTVECGPDHTGRPRPYVPARRHRASGPGRGGKGGRDNHRAGPALQPRRRDHRPGRHDPGSRRGSEATRLRPRPARSSTSTRLKSFLWWIPTAGSPG